MNAVHGLCVNHASIHRIGNKFIMRGVVSTPVPVTFPFSGRPVVGQVINVPMVTNNSIDVNLTGTTTYAGTLPTNNAVFTVNKVSPLGLTVVIGTITLTNASNFSCLLSGPGGLFSAGDVLQLVAPTVQDATLADVGITVFTMREV